jgi:hypothetical protein
MAASDFPDGAVWIAAHGTTGTASPRGQPTMPVNNLADGLSIANTNNLKHYKFVGAFANYTITAAHLDWTFDSSAASGNTAITLSTASVEGSTFLYCDLDGTYTGGTGQFAVVDGGMTDLSRYAGTMQRGYLGGTIGVNSNVQFNDCRRLLSSTLILNLAAGLVDAQVDRFSGDISLANMDAAGDVFQIGMDSGVLTINSTCTAGTITVRGIARLVNNGGASLVVNTVGLIDPSRLQAIMNDNMVLDNFTFDTVTGKVTGTRHRSFSTGTLAGSAATGAAADADSELTRETMTTTYSSTTGRPTRVQFVRNK